MTALVLLDAGPLGMATNPRGSEKTRRCKAWLRALLEADVRAIVPEVCAYEVRRELLHAGRAEAGRRLDALIGQVGLLAVTGATWRRAAELWAQARRGGLPTADPHALDGDVILAAQAQLAAEAGFGVTVATDNVGHLGRFAGYDARPWEDIEPDEPG